MSLAEQHLIFHMSRLVAFLCVKVPYKKIEVRESVITSKLGKRKNEGKCIELILEKSKQSYATN